MATGHTNLLTTFAAVSAGLMLTACAGQPDRAAATGPLLTQPTDEILRAAGCVLIGTGKNKILTCPVARPPEADKTGRVRLQPA